MKLIGIAGKSGVGKDTLGVEIASHLNRNRLLSIASIHHFADALKEYCATKYDIPLSHFYDPYFKESVNGFWGVSPREIAQFEGTEATRNVVDKLLGGGMGADFWIHRLKKSFRPDISYPIICDVRFQNEADWVLNNSGLLIHVVRPGYEGEVGISNHASEAGFKINLPTKGVYHVIINDKSINAFIDAGISIVNSFTGLHHV
jgi:hypothetical protein